MIQPSSPNPQLRAEWQRKGSGHDFDCWVSKIRVSAEGRTFLGPCSCGNRCRLCRELSRELVAARVTPTPRHDPDSSAGLRLRDFLAPQPLVDRRFAAAKGTSDSLGPVPLTRSSRAGVEVIR
jgi:hypothetical protein